MTASHTVDYGVKVTILSHRVLCHQALDFKTWPGRSLFSAPTNRDTPVAIIQRNLAFVKLIWVNADVESDLRKLPHILRIIIANK